MVTTASAFSTAAAVEPTGRHPAFFARSSASAERSKARTSCPAFARFAAMPLPMLPRPINATRAILLALPIGLTLVDESGHAFFLVFGSEETVEQAALIGDALRQRHFEDGVDLLLGPHRRDRRHRRDRPGGFPRLLDQLVIWHNARRQRERAR